MLKVTVNPAGCGYDVMIERGLLDRLGELCAPVLPRAQRIALVTDEAVRKNFGARARRSLERCGFLVTEVLLPRGEGAKAESALFALYRALAEALFCRDDAILALGGGTIGDVSGFAAATFLRGLDYIQVPTTLLAQVDASVGGKTAINLDGVKNMVGAFWQPKRVLADPDCLESLSCDGFSDGMAEVIKYGCVLDPDLFCFLESHPTRALVMDHIEEIVAACCGAKGRVVSEDERDRGARMLLNFGHTIGHAYELSGGAEPISHGKAVAAGMCLETRLSEKFCGAAGDAFPRLEGLVRAFGLPVRLDCSMERYEQAILHDKKICAERIRFPGLVQIGSGVIFEVETGSFLSELWRLLS